MKLHLQCLYPVHLLYASNLHAQVYVFKSQQCMLIRVCKCMKQLEIIHCTCCFLHQDLQTLRKKILTQGLTNKQQLFSYPELLFLALQNTVTVSQVWKAEYKISVTVINLELENQKPLKVSNVLLCRACGKKVD